MLTCAAKPSVCGRALSCVFSSWKSFVSFFWGDTISTSEVEAMPRGWGAGERRNIFGTRRNLWRLPHVALELPGICLLVSSWFLASTAGGLFGGLALWVCVRVSQRVAARLKPEEEFGSCILATHLGHGSSVPWKRRGPRAAVLGASPVCKVAAVSLVTQC